MTSVVLAFAVAGTALGGMAAMLPDVIRQRGWGQEFLSRYSGNRQASIVDIFLELVIVSLAMTARFYPVTAMLRLRSEEVAGRAELVLSTAVGRVGWAMSHLVLSMLGTLAVLAAGGVAAGGYCAAAARRVAALRGGSGLGGPVIRAARRRGPRTGVSRANL